MKISRQRNLSALAIILFTIGITVGVLFYAFSFWADFEASLFDAGLDGDANLDNLRCPILIGKNETGVIHSTFTNPLERAFTPNVRAHISDGFVTLMREIDTKLNIPPGETQTLKWEITAQDAVWNRFILFRAYQFPFYPDPTRSATCGVLLLNLPFSGALSTVLIIFISLAGMGSGIWLYYSSNRPIKDRQRSALIAMIVLGVVIAAGIISSLLAELIINMVILLLTVLLVIVMLAYFLNR
jgi:hypothetical protein